MYSAIRSCLICRPCSENTLEININATKETVWIVNKIYRRSLIIRTSHRQEIIDAETIKIAVEDKQLG